MMSINSSISNPILHSFIQMSKQVLIGMLQQGNTGNEILSILDVIAEEENSNQTINEIADLLFDW